MRLCPGCHVTATCVNWKLGGCQRLYPSNAFCSCLLKQSRYFIAKFWKMKKKYKYKYKLSVIVQSWQKWLLQSPSPIACVSNYMPLPSNHLVLVSSHCFPTWARADHVISLSQMLHIHHSQLTSSTFPVYRHGMQSSTLLCTRSNDQCWLMAWWWEWMCANRGCMSGGL